MPLTGTLQKPSRNRIPSLVSGDIPRELPEAFIQILTEPGDLIFDPYGGAGSSASAALRNSRRILTTDLNLVANLATYVRSGFELLTQQLPDQVMKLLDSVDEFLKKADRNTFSNGLFPPAQTRFITEWLSKFMRQHQNRW